MLLGTIMTHLQDEQMAAATLLLIGDLVLVARVEAARMPHGETVGEYVSGAAHRFANTGTDEDWLALTTALERSHTPAVTCLETMVRWSLARDLDAAPSHDCSCGGGEGSRQEKAEGKSLTGEVETRHKAQMNNMRDNQANERAREKDAASDRPQEMTFGQATRS
jgi:hypothetical protein